MFPASCNAATLGKTHAIHVQFASALEKRARSQPVNRLVRVVDGRRMVINTGANAFTYVEREPIAKRYDAKP